MQKLNKNSITETEVVGLSDFLPFNRWMNNFLQAQIYELNENKNLQDNKFEMRMKNNVRMLFTGNLQHISFFKYRVDKGKVSIEYFLTHIMLADYFTKPLQGKMFRITQEVIMGHKSLSYLASELTSS